MYYTSFKIRTIIYHDYTMQLWAQQSASSARYAGLPSWPLRIRITSWGCNAFATTAIHVKLGRSLSVSRIWTFLNSKNIKLALQCCYDLIHFTAMSIFYNQSPQLYCMVKRYIMLWIINKRKARLLVKEGRQYSTTCCGQVNCHKTLNNVKKRVLVIWWLLCYLRQHSYQSRALA